MNRIPLCVLLLATSVALADDAAKSASGGAAVDAGKTKEAAPSTSNDDPNLGMSILGNQEAPKALVIVPWKRSEIGSALGISTMLDDSRLPIDKEVFMRMLSYYEIRSETAHPSGATTDGNATAPATAAQRRKP